MKNDKLEPGYRTFTGHVMDEVEVESYNRYTAEIERTRNPDTQEFLKDQRHRYFCDICGVQGG